MTTSLTTISAYDSMSSSIVDVRRVVGDDYHHHSSFSGVGGAADNLIDNRVNEDENFTDNTYLDMMGNMTTPSTFTDPHSMMEIVTLLREFTNNSKSHCDSSSMYDLGTSYKKIHGYLALFVCVFGVIANILIMVVLTRKEMRTPVNLMLFALAMADLLIMIEYIPFALHMYLIQNPPEIQFSLNWARFVFFHNHFTQILHTISIQLTLSMAIWRYVAIKCSNRSTSFCTFRRCYQVIASAYICPLFFCILNYLYFRIQPRIVYHTSLPPSLDEIDEQDQSKVAVFYTVCHGLNEFYRHTKPDFCETNKMTLYYVEMSELAQEYPILHKMHFWTFSVIIKLIPCVVLTFFMCWLVNTLYKARRHHKMLERRSNPTAYPMSTIGQNGESQPLSPDKSNAEIVMRNSPRQSNGTLQSSIRSKSIGRNSIRSPKDEAARPALLGAAGDSKVGNNKANGSIGNNQLIPSPHHIQVPNDGEQSGSNSRRASGESSGELKESHNGMRRFTKGFIRFPSIRRPSNSKGNKSSKRTDRTTKMLMAVLVLFLLTEFPQGIMHFLTGWYGPEFFRCYYNTWAEVWDMLALINSAVNFILYCFMSKQFRTQFRLSFNVHCFHKYKFMGMSTCNNQATVSTTV
ncbi:unnamed protein product [Orchesella dallaii]|uniref:G-protein coupled receptors family 1 profile domain-containing protein n=1 Tax=Orchesella dallaii TaxID=48710 RepID=A0ABP1QIR4_9HEXA